MTIIIRKQKIVNIILLIIVFFSLFLVGYFYFKLNKLEKISKINTNKEAENILSKVSNLYLLPSKEEPTIATVSDPNVLKNQSFFLLSKKDDKVLIFTKAGKAVLYRPSIDKIIEIAPIKNNSLNSVNPQPNTDETNAPSVKEKTN